MADYRRYFVPGGTYFFTVVTCRRRPIFADPLARELLGQAIRGCQAEWPFTISALVLLHDHLHAIWTLPTGDQRYPARWSRIKATFTKTWLAAGGRDAAVSAASRREHRRGVWQRRFWEHVIRDENDFDLRFDYAHFNPVKHQYVACPRDWEPSTFHCWVEAGVYPPDWACGRYPPPDFSKIEGLCGEPE